MNKKSVENIVNAFRSRFRHKYPPREDYEEFVSSVTQIAAIEPLVACLKADEPFYLQWAASDALVQIGESAVPALIANLQYAESHEQIAHVLGRIGGIEAATALIKLLTLPSAKSQMAAATALGKLGAIAVEPLITAINEDSGNVRYKVAEIFAQLENVNVIDKISLFLQHKDRVTRAAAGKVMVRAGSTSIPALIRVLKTENNPDIRASAKYFLTMIGTPAIPYLLDVLINDDNRTQLDAIETLGFIEHSSSVPTLISKLNGGEQERIVTMLALGRIGDYRARKPLNNLLNHESELTRETAQQALRWLEDEQRVNPLVRALWYAGTEQWMTAQFLGYSGDERAIEPLLLILRFSLSTRTIIYVVNALVKLDTQNPIFVDTLIELLSTFNHGLDDFYSVFLTETIARALVQLGDSRAIEPLFTTFQQRQTPALITALARFQDKRIIDTLIKQALTPPPERYSLWGHSIQPISVLALAQFPDERSIHTLVSLLNDKRQEVQFAAITALSKIGAPAINALITTLNDSDKTRRAYAAKVLGHISDKQSLHYLRLATQDKNKRVRQEAEFAIRRITSNGNFPS